MKEIDDDDCNGQMLEITDHRRCELINGEGAVADQTNDCFRHWIDKENEARLWNEIVALQ